MCKVYGYARISRKSQNIERQVRNIKGAYEDAIILQEAFTGTKIQGRKELDKLVRMVKAGDTIVFDSASRMSRNADEAVELYQDLFQRDINLVFLREPHINSATYRQALNNQIEVTAKTGNESTDNFIAGIIEALNRYTVDLAKDQIRIVFQQAQKEVDDLHRRTSEGIETARLNGKQIGRVTGSKVETKKAKEAKDIILQHSKSFGGSLSDDEVMKLAGITHNSLYKYKRELRLQIALDK